MIELQGITRQFDGRAVLNGVDLTFADGETHVILGRSGTGKSVLLKILSGLLAPDSGVYRLDGRRIDLDDARSLRHVRRRVQMLFQGGALFDSMTVNENVAFHAVEHGRVKHTECAEFAQPYLAMVDLAEAGEKKPAELSGGMRKRAALARALAAEPRVMLYDEPTTGLDPITCQVVNRLIRETGQRLGATSIIVTHDIRSAQEVGDRCSFLADGHILETTTPLELGRSAHDIVRSFLDDAVVRA